MTQGPSARVQFYTAHTDVIGNLNYSHKERELLCHCNSLSVVCQGLADSPKFSHLKMVIMNIHDIGQSTLCVLTITNVILSDRDSLRVCAGPGTYSGGHLGSSSPQISNRFARKCRHCTLSKIIC